HDIDGDMINDFIICNGGDPYIQDNKTPRPIAKMLIISGGNGNVISSANVVDGKESYCSPVVANLDPNSEEVSIVYGTGEESIGGSIHSTSITGLLTGDLNNSIQICTDSTRGFIAPPGIFAINNDG